MTQQLDHVYEFGPFRVNPGERILSREGKPVPVSAKAFDTLLFMLQRSGHLIEKEELIRAIWPDSFVEEGNLKVVIWALRKAFEVDVGGAKYIQTVAKHGYRFVGEVRIPRTEPEIVPASPPAIQLVEHVHNDSKFGLAIKAGVLVFGLLIVAAVLIRFEKHVTPGVEETRISSLAVLPFEPLNLPPGKKYLGLGIADGVITRLGSTGEIVVRPTSSVAKYADSPSDPLAIGRKLKVDAVLEGEIEILSDEARVNVQLVRARDGYLLWADTFVKPPDQIFALEEEVAERVAGSDALHLTGVVDARLTPEETKDSKAYSLYLHGLYFLNKRTPDSVRQSINYFHQAIAQDREYAPSYADLAVAYVALGSYGESSVQLYPNAEEAAAKAVDLDHSLAAAHAALAQESFHYGWNWAEADKQFQSAIQLNPNDAMVRAWYAQYLAAMGRNKEALEQGELAQQLDPVSPTVNTAVARILYWTRNYDQAIDRFREVLTLEPQFSNAHTRLGLTYLAKGDFGEAVREFETARKLSDTNPYLDGLFGYAEARIGNTIGARKVLGDLTRRSHTQYVPAFCIALVYIGLGDHDRAMDGLEKAYQERSTYMVYAKIDALLDPIRSDRRFIDLIQKMGM